jgi:hypothetical protein
MTQVYSWIEISTTCHIVSQTQDEANLAETSILITSDTHIQHWANVIIDPDTGASMEYRHLIKGPKHRTSRVHSFANELGRLAQGVGGREVGTNNIFFNQTVDLSMCRDTSNQHSTHFNIPSKTRPACTAAQVDRTKLWRETAIYRPDGRF